jgi:hypothetical protein
MKRAVFVSMEMRIGPLNQVLIGLMTLLVEPSGSRLKGLLTVGDGQ